MSASAAKIVTIHGGAAISVITSPMNLPVQLDTLLGYSSVIATLQAQVADLTARVVALENP